MPVVQGSAVRGIKEVCPGSQENGEARMFRQSFQGRQPELNPSECVIVQGDEAGRGTPGGKSRCKSTGAEQASGASAHAIKAGGCNTW